MKDRHGVAEAFIALLIILWIIYVLLFQLERLPDCRSGDLYS
jgi:DNA-binding transcriptional regulator of glucitol operon